MPPVTTAHASASHTAPLSIQVCEAIARLTDRPHLTTLSSYSGSSCTQMHDDKFWITPIEGGRFRASTFRDQRVDLFAMTTCATVEAAVRWALRQIGEIGGDDE